MATLIQPLLAVLLATTPAAVQAPGLLGFLSAAELADHCADPANADGKFDVCLGYLAGVLDTAMASARADRICLPADLKIEDLRVRVLAAIQARPDPGKVAAAAVIRHVLNADYSCTEA